MCFCTSVFVAHLNHHAARTRDPLVKDTSSHGLIYKEGNLAALTCMDVALTWEGCCQPEIFFNDTPTKMTWRLYKFSHIRQIKCSTTFVLTTIIYYTDKLKNIKQQCTTFHQPASNSLSRASAVYFFWGEEGLHDNPSTAPIINSEHNKS